MLVPCCQEGMGMLALMPPPVAAVPEPVEFQFQDFSETHDPKGPVVVRVVPPTAVTYG